LIAPRLPSAHVLEIAGARHEILMETDGVRAQFWQAFDAFAIKALEGAKFVGGSK
jgi:lysophospholipase